MDTMILLYVEGEKFEYEAGRFYNQNVAPVSSDYKGKQYWYMYGAKTTDRYSSDFLNERENFFHKPLVNLNHFYDINDDIRLSSVAYWSGGSGGGTGTYGSVSRKPAIEGKDGTQVHLGCGIGMERLLRTHLM